VVYLTYSSIRKKNRQKKKVDYLNIFLLLLFFSDVNRNDGKMSGMYGTVNRFSKMATDKNYIDSVDQWKTQHCWTKFQVKKKKQIKIYGLCFSIEMYIVMERHRHIALMIEDNRMRNYLKDMVYDLI
jgi:hypothetical protein